jgi:hypothetical protein
LARKARRPELLLEVIHQLDGRLMLAIADHPPRRTAGDFRVGWLGAADILTRVRCQRSALDVIGAPSMRWIATSIQLTTPYVIEDERNLPG